MEHRPHQYNHQVALYGLGGVGKTQVAIEYVYSYQKFYTGIFWIDAPTESALLEGFQSIARKVGYKPKGIKAKEVAREVIAWLEIQTRWLLILDSLDDISILSPRSRDGQYCGSYLPSPYGRSHILITTRNCNSDGIPAIGLEVEMLDQNAASKLLLIRSRIEMNGDCPSSRSEALNIVGELGCLPLAVEQAAAYIREACKDIHKFLPIYKAQQAYVHRRTPQGNWDYSQSVATTWTLSFKVIERQNPIASKLLRLFAFLNPDGVLKPFLQAGKAGLDNDLQTALRCDELFDGALFVLEQFSLIRRSNASDVVTIHRLVQAVVKDQFVSVNATSGDGTQVLKDTDIRIEEMWRTVVNICHHAFPNETTNKNRSICRLFQEQVIVPLTSVPDYNWVELRSVLRKVAAFLEDDGKYKQSEPLLQKIIRICQKYQGETHPDTLLAVHALATSYYEQDRFPEALRQLDFVFQAQKSVLGLNDGATLCTMADLATIYGAMGRDDLALQLQKSAIEGMKLVMGDNHSITLGVMAHLAISYVGLSRLEEARRIQSSLLEIRKTEYGDQHNRTLTVMAQLGTTCFLQNDYKAAIDLLEAALNGFKANLGERHPKTLSAMSALAQCYIKLGRRQEAVDLQKWVLDVRRIVFGEWSPRTLKAMLDLARSYSSQGKHIEAVKLAEEGLHGLELVFGAGHPRAAKAQELLVRIKSKIPRPMI